MKKQTNLRGAFYLLLLLAVGVIPIAFGQRRESTPTTTLPDSDCMTWSVTGGLNTARALHTATLLPNGKVLVAGGPDNSAPSTSPELYNATSGTWTTTGSLNTARYFQHGDLAAQRQGSYCRGI
jgi:hypothetical protein